MATSIYRKVIDEKNNRGELKKQITIDLSPWIIEADLNTGREALSGYTTQIKVVKLGSNPKTSIVNFDPFNDEIRNSFIEMFDQVDNLNKI